MTVSTSWILRTETYIPQADVFDAGWVVHGSLLADGEKRSR